MRTTVAEYFTMLASTTMLSGTDAGKKVSYPAFVARLSLPLFLSVSLLFTGAHSRQPATLSIDAVSAYHLCGLGSDTILQLSGGVHYLEEGPFCFLQNLENIAIQGQRTRPRTVVYCHSETQMRRGITFFKIANVHLSHIDIVNCSREVPVDRLVKSTTPLHTLPLCRRQL